jgi:hypothetical protein
MLLADPSAGIRPAPHTDAEVAALGVDHYGGTQATSPLASARAADDTAPPTRSH